MPLEPVTTSLRSGLPTAQARRKAVPDYLPGVSIRKEPVPGISVCSSCQGANRQRSRLCLYVPRISCPSTFGEARESSPYSRFISCITQCTCTPFFLVWWYRLPMQWSDTLQLKAWAWTDRKLGLNLQTPRLSSRTRCRPA